MIVQMNSDQPTHRLRNCSFRIDKLVQIAASLNTVTVRSQPRKPDSLTKHIAFR